MNILEELYFSGCNILLLNVKKYCLSGIFWRYAKYRVSGILLTINISDREPCLNLHSRSEAAYSYHQQGLPSPFQAIPEQLRPPFRGKLACRHCVWYHRWHQPQEKCPLLSWAVPWDEMLYRYKLQQSTMVNVLLTFLHDPCDLRSLAILWLSEKTDEVDYSTARTTLWGPLTARTHIDLQKCLVWICLDQLVGIQQATRKDLPGSSFANFNFSSFLTAKNFSRALNMRPISAMKDMLVKIWHAKWRLGLSKDFLTIVLAWGCLDIDRE